MLLIKAVLVPSVRAPHQGEGAIFQMRQDEFADRLVVERELALGDARLRIERLGWIGEPDAGDAIVRIAGAGRRYASLPQSRCRTFRNRFGRAVVILSVARDAFGRLLADD